MLKKDLLPIRNFKQAAICATLLFLLLVIIRHPVEELALTAAVLYVFLWLSKEVIERLVIYVLSGLVRYMGRIEQKPGAADWDSQSPQPNFVANASAVIMVALWLFAIIGAGFTLGSLAVNGAGLTPLPGYITVIAGGAFLAGTIGVSLILGLIALVLVAVDNLSESVNPRFNQFDAITRQVDTRLRNKALTRQSPATS